MIEDPSIARVAADLRHPAFASGCADGRWRVVLYEFPTLDFAVRATEPDGTASEYGFRADLSNYPAQAPLVRIWDHAQNAPLADDRRPRGGRRVLQAFKHWGADTVYRPWDRQTGPHNNNTVAYPHLAWNPERRLDFVLEDLHGILNSNARAQGCRSCS